MLGRPGNVRGEIAAEDMKASLTLRLLGLAIVIRHVVTVLLWLQLYLEWLHLAIFSVKLSNAGETIEYSGNGFFVSNVLVFFIHHCEHNVQNLRMQARAGIGYPM